MLYNEIYTRILIKIVYYSASHVLMVCLCFQAIYNSLREHQHPIEAVNRHGGQYIREAKVRIPDFCMININHVWFVLSVISLICSMFHRMPWFV